MSIIDDMDRSIAAKSINRARPNRTPTDAAKEIVDSFIVSLQHVHAQQAYRDIGSEFITTFSRYYNESKSILRQGANRSLIPNNYTVVFPFQVKDRMKEDTDFMKLLRGAKDDAAKATFTNQQNYIKIMKSANKISKSQVVEFVARSISQLSHIVLITHSAAEYGSHNLIADILLTSHRDILKHLCGLERFVEIYKRVNQCGRTPEEAQVLLDRLTPSTEAANEISVADGIDENAAIAAKSKTIPPTPGETPTAKGNLKCPDSIYKGVHEETSALTDSSTPRGFITASEMLRKMQEDPGVDMVALLTEMAKSEPVTQDVTTPKEDDSVIPSKKGASKLETPRPVLSPLRTLKQPQTDKVYFSRKYSRAEIEALSEGTELSQLHRCKNLALIDSIREDNYVEGSLLSQSTSDTNDTPAKRLFSSLEEVDYESFDHPQAMNDLNIALINLFHHPRAMYITQYMYNLQEKDLKKSQMKYSTTTLASKSTERMTSESNSANPPVSDQTIEAIADAKVERKVNKLNSKREATDNEIIERLVSVEQTLKIECAKRKQAELELLTLKSHLAEHPKEDVPSDNSGKEIIELLDEGSTPQKKVNFETSPPRKKNHPPASTLHSNQLNRLEPNLHNRAKKRRNQHIAATDADRDTSTDNQDKPLQQLRKPSGHANKKKQHKKKRRGDTRTR